MGQKEWEWMREEIKQLNNSEEETPSLYDRYFERRRRSRRDSIKILKWLGVLFVSMSLIYWLFKDQF